MKIDENTEMNVYKKHPYLKVKGKNGFHYEFEGVRYLRFYEVVKVIEEFIDYKIKNPF